MGLLMLKVASDRWVEKCINSLVFVISSTFVLSLIRIFFFHHYKSPDLVWSDFYPALIMGMRVDAKWRIHGFFTHFGREFEHSQGPKELQKLHPKE